MKILLVASSGGHLAQLTTLRPWWGSHTRHWVTFDTQDAKASLAGEATTWAFHPTTRNIPNLLRNTILAWRVIRAERPQLIVSTGAGVAFPFFVLSRFFKVATCYIEVLDRIDSRTMTGRLCYPLADAMYVQLEEQIGLYPQADVIGATL